MLQLQYFKKIETTSALYMHSLSVGSSDTQKSHNKGLIAGYKESAQTLYPVPINVAMTQ